VCNRKADKENQFHASLLIYVSVNQSLNCNKALVSLSKQGDVVGMHRESQKNRSCNYRGNESL
jgi:hypothetical protein